MDEINVKFNHVYAHAGTSGDYGGWKRILWHTLYRSPLFHAIIWHFDAKRTEIIYIYIYIIIFRKTLIFHVYHWLYEREVNKYESYQLIHLINTTLLILNTTSLNNTIHDKQQLFTITFLHHYLLLS